MTYGQIRQRLVQGYPGVSLDLIDGWIMDRYQEILDSLTWKRLSVQRSLLTKPEYNTGTVTAAQFSTAISGAGTTWDATMNQRLLRINATEEFYSFNFSTTTAAALDRGYEQASGSGLPYRINQNLYSLGGDVRSVSAVRTADGDLTYLTLAQLNLVAPGRNSYGVPTNWTWYADAVSDPPAMQIEIYPIPIVPVSLFLSLDIDTAGLEQGVTSSSVLPWVRPSCLIAGCEADIKLHLEDVNGSDRKEARFNKLLTAMRAIDNEASGPTPLGIADRYTRHQRGRWNSGERVNWR